MASWKEIKYKNPNYGIDNDNRQYLNKFVLVGNGFVYNGSSTNDIISSAKLVLVSNSKQINLAGTTSSKVASNATLFKPKQNEYGLQKTNLSFTYCLIKNDTSKFTDKEQEIVESWLTSPTKSSELIIFDGQNDNENDAINDENIKACYEGIFTNTSWYMSETGCYMLQFTFETTAPYPYKKYVSDKFTIDNNDINNPTEIEVDCLTDEYDSYIYPTMVVSSTTTTDASVITEPNFILTNTSDNNNTLKMRLITKGLEMYVNNEICTITDELMLNHYSYSSILWNDVSNIYWLKFKSGKNKLKIVGNCTIQFYYKYPVKTVGDWL